ncbi:MAG: ribbon-helix-helix protein, CopG family [Euryarchaeota archaeon TMED248]|nr:hypothetical protein [Euryarchaeota archaeon]RPG72356.1 MAG: ribbon-helix-helix protein, CopG family [Euryarchaeota archaeon TMED248]|tara:strand:+ start:12126 stop:12500 length:375 start_codon:yes stop_codon:yes gene_type:complete
MTAPSTLISLRITEEDLQLLDSRIGTDGSRSRSDVVRLAIQEFLSGQPLLPDMDSVRIPLGRGDKLRLGHLYELQGTTTQEAAQQGLKLFISQALEKELEETKQLEEAVAKARTSTIKREEYQQ